MTAELSAKMRAYLAEIYRLIDRQLEPVDYVSTSQLAEILDVSPPAVNRAVNRLSKHGLLLHQPYQGIAITEAGRVEALKHIRKQRIAEVFLVQVMQMSWLEVSEEARRLSDGLSDAVVQRMVDMTDKPAACPHGEPIPEASGTLPPASDVYLSRVEAGATVRVSRLITRDSERLQYVEALGLVPGQVCDVIHVAPFEGPMQLKLGREFRIIGQSLARLIRVDILP